MSTRAMVQQGLRPRLVGMAAVAGSIFALTLLAMWMSQSMDASVYDSLPDAMRALAGIPAGADVEVMAYAQMVGFMGALTTAAFAVAVGAHVVAGQEQDRTLPLVLAQPVSRLRVAGARIVVLVAVVAIIGAGLWGLSLLATLPFDVDLGQAHLGALTLALGANALFCGSVAFCLGAATGRKGLALGVGTLVLLLGWLAAGLLPLTTATEGLVDLVPWAWYSRPEVLVNGLDGAALAKLLGGSVLLLLLGVVGFRLRDVGTPVPLIPSLPRRRRTTRRLAVPRRGLTLTGLALRRHRTLFLVVAVVASGIMGLLMGPMYEQMVAQLESLSETMPAAVFQVWGADDMTTPAGFYWAETLGVMAPVAVITVGVVPAVALASDERNRRLAMILTATTRTRLLGATLATQVVLVVAIAALTGLGIWGGARLGNLDLPAAHIAGATLHLAALGLFVSATASLAAAASGRPAVATWTAVGVGVIGYAVNVAVTMAPRFEGWAVVSPFHWYGSARPLHNGANWGHVAVMLVGAVALWAVAHPLFQRRDLNR